MTEETKNTELKTTELAPIAPPSEAGIQKFSDADYAMVASGGGYLPRVQLMIATSDPVKRGQFTQNHYALVKDKKCVDLGSTVDVLVLEFRPKALRLGDQIISLYNPKSDEFKKIAEESATPNSGCMFGPEYLVWIPSIKEFATFFMGSSSARRESQPVQVVLNKWKTGEIKSPAITLKSQFIEGKKNSWQAPLVTSCSTPLEVPSVDEARKQIEKFLKVKDSEIETVEEGTDRAR